MQRYFSMSIRKPANTWKQSFFIWLWANVGGSANFLFAFPNYHLPESHWWLATGTYGAQIAVLTLILVPVSHLVFQNLLPLTHPRTRQLLVSATIIGFTAIGWVLVLWWFSDWISYAEYFSGVALGYFLASLLAHALVYRKSLFAVGQIAIDGFDA